MHASMHDYEMETATRRRYTDADDRYDPTTGYSWRDNDASPRFEMQERPRSSQNDILFDAGPASRADSIFSDTHAASSRPRSPVQPQAAADLAQYRASLQNPPAAPFDLLSPSQEFNPSWSTISSPHGSLTAYSVIEPDEPRVSSSRVVSPTPTAQDTTDPVDRVTSPFSDYASVSGTLDGLVLSDRESAWSDLGEDSSDDDEVARTTAASSIRQSQSNADDGLRRRRQAYFGANLATA